MKEDLSVHSAMSIGSNCGKTTKNTLCPRYVAHSVYEKRQYMHIDLVHKYMNNFMVDINTQFNGIIHPKMKNSVIYSTSSFHSPVARPGSTFNSLTLGSF